MKGRVVTAAYHVRSSAQQSHVLVRAQTRLIRRRPHDRCRYHAASLL